MSMMATLEFIAGPKKAIKFQAQNSVSLNCMRYIDVLMRILFTLCFLALVVSSNAQEVLFKITSFSTGVSLQERPVSFGMDVVASGEKLIIPKGGFVGVITQDGYSYKLTSTVSVTKVPSF